MKFSMLLIIFDSILQLFVNYTTLSHNLAESTGERKIPEINYRTAFEENAHDIPYAHSVVHFYFST